MRFKGVTFIIGAGAVENGWTPVVRAINKTFGIQTDQEGANFKFAQQVYLMRFYSHVSASGKYREPFEAMKSNMLILKQNIAKELEQAQVNKEIKPRNNFKEIVEKFARIGIDRLGVVTTNWDTVIDQEINRLYRSFNPEAKFKVACYHLHGSIDLPNELYLPSESTQESYRPTKEEVKLGQEHSLFMSMIQKGNRTVLYGISLDPLDSELNLALAAAWYPVKNHDIVIVNPNHELVAKRVNLLLDKHSKVKVTGYSPKYLDKEIVYREASI